MGPLPPRRRPPRSSGIAIRNLNTRDSRGLGLTQAIQAVERGDFDVMILTKTNIFTTAYCRNRLGYKATCSAAQPSSARGSQGGVGLVRRERPVGWGIESTRYHGPNVVICELFTGLNRTSLVGAYLPPSKMDHLPDL